MHSLRARANRCACRQDGKSPNWNPYARRRPSSAGRSNNDIEAGTRTAPSPQRTHSESCVSPVAETKRAEGTKRINKEYGPQHASTMPALAQAAIPAIVPEERDNSQTSVDSTSETVVDNPTPGIDGSKPRRRKFLKLGRGNINQHLHRTTSSVSSTKLKHKITVGGQIRAVLFKWINILLLAVPIGFALEYAHVRGVAVFIVNFVAIIPLAGILSSATEELALHVGETLGGLLNATFGNAVELIVSIQALLKGKIIIVKTSLIGSMLSNLLLVLGMAFWLGGINRLEQHFNVTVAQTASSLLAICIGSLIIPTVFHDWSYADEGAVDKLSYGTAIILLFIYACYLLFQLRTHIDLYNAPSEKVEKKKSSKLDEGAVQLGIAHIGAGTAAASGGQVNQSNLVQQTPEEEEGPELTVIGGIVTLLLSTVLVAFCSEFMVSGIDEITKGGVSEVFVGLILLPIVGNAAEHATAVTVAIKDKMDLAIGVAVGSSMQIALLVLPLIVLLGWITNHQCMTLYFDGFQIAVLFVAVLLVNYLIQDGKSHWLEGMLLICTYVIIAVASLFYPNQAEWGNENGHCFRESAS